MQGPANDQRRVLLLAGTGEGPRLVKELSRRNWRVSVSVVTPNAAKAYAGLAVERISIGALQGVGGITADEVNGVKAMALQPASRAEVLFGVGVQITEADVRAALEV